VATRPGRIHLCQFMPLFYPLSRPSGSTQMHSGTAPGGRVRDLGSHSSRKREARNRSQAASAGRARPTWTNALAEGAESNASGPKRKNPADRSAGFEKIFRKYSDQAMTKSFS